MRKHSVNFDHADLKVYASIKELDDSADFDLDRYLSSSARTRGDYDPTLAQFAMLRRAVAELKIEGDLDGDGRRKMRTFAIGSEKKSPPRVKDPESGKTIGQHLLGHVIKFNTFLVEEEDYREAFEEYVLDDEVVPRSDPTHFRAVGE